MQLYQDIPRIYTALAEWCACMVYLYMLRGKEKSVSTIMGSIFFLGLQCAFLVLTGDLPTAFWIPCMAAAVGFMYLFLVIFGRLTI